MPQQSQAMSAGLFFLFSTKIGGGRGTLAPHATPCIASDYWKLFRQWVWFESNLHRMATMAHVWS